MTADSLLLAFSTDGGPGFRGSTIPSIKIHLVLDESKVGASFVGTFGQIAVTGRIVNDRNFRGVNFYDESNTQIAAGWIAPDRSGRKRFFVNDGLNCYPIDVDPDLDPSVIASITELDGWLDKHREEYSLKYPLGG